MSNDGSLAELLARAKEAQEKANKEFDPVVKRAWEELEKEYLKLAEVRHGFRSS